MALFGKKRQDPQELAEEVMAMAEPAPRGVQAWEYLQLFGSRDNQTLSSSDGREWPFGSDNVVILALGSEGWELVTVLPPTQATHGFWYIFKRPLAETDE